MCSCEQLPLYRDRSRLHGQDRRNPRCQELSQCVCRADFAGETGPNDSEHSMAGYGLGGEAFGNGQNPLSGGHGE